MTSPYFLIFESSRSSSAPKCRTLQERPKLSHSSPEGEGGVEPLKN
uniref:Uncharacterized protein n=1 Tax=Heterorhabditis bacteriophora TaxID=37862 RepID=A0A1I7WES6_HETBA